MSHTANTSKPPNTDFFLPAGWSPRQGTLANALHIEGRGLHAGRKVRVRILPCPPGSQSGIVFRRMDRGRVRAEVSGSLEHWFRQPLCSSLKRPDGGMIQTVEHLMASLLACEIDQAIVELDEDELPILDGGARQWIETLRACGRAELPSPKRFIRIKKRKELLFSNEGRCAVDPADSYHIDMLSLTDNFPPMRWAGSITPQSFSREIAPTRSYGDLRLALPGLIYGLFHRQPVLRGAWRSGVAMLVGGHVLGGMLLPDEFARHRVLDMVGDFALAGAPLLGRVTAFLSSHQRNCHFLRWVLSDRSAWEWADASKDIS